MSYFCWKTVIFLLFFRFFDKICFFRLCTDIVWLFLRCIYAVKFYFKKVKMHKIPPRFLLQYHIGFFNKNNTAIILKGFEWRDAFGNSKQTERNKNVTLFQKIPERVKSYTNAFWPTKNLKKLSKKYKNRAKFTINSKNN